MLLFSSYITSFKITTLDLIITVRWFIVGLSVPAMSEFEFFAESDEAVGDDKHQWSTCENHKQQKTQNLKNHDTSKEQRKGQGICRLMK